jgi:hypothetical protein
MNRRRLGIGVALLAALVTAGGLGHAAEERKSGGSFGFKGFVEVKQFDVLYVPGASMQVKAHLANGMAIEDEFKDAEAIDRVLQISATFAQPRARLAVTLEGSKIAAFHLSTGGSGGR